MRKLKFHEERLLRKTSFEHWRGEHNIREHSVLQRYRVTDREDYERYNRLCGDISHLVSLLQKLESSDPVRARVTSLLADKLFHMGIVSEATGQLASIASEKITVSAFCRRRLPVVMVKNKFCETLREAVTFVQQGHVRVGTEIVTDPGFIVTRPNEDLVTWADGSKIQRAVKEYAGQRDDFDEIA
eukprot:ANDGO_03224.mRNA.1 U3 small nucleolar ribonucleoprotein IMP3